MEKIEKACTSLNSCEKCSSFNITTQSVIEEESLQINDNCTKYLNSSFDPITKVYLDENTISFNQTRCCLGNRILLYNKGKCCSKINLILYVNSEIFSFILLTPCQGKSSLEVILDTVIIDEGCGNFR